jgi:hypothetical protein
MDSIRYLIENEVAANGIRNLQTHIPAERAFSIKEDSVFVNNSGFNANLQNGERSATNGQVRQSDTFAQLESRTTNEAAIGKEPEKRITDDDIDDEDIESWT